MLIRLGSPRGTLQNETCECFEQTQKFICIKFLSVRLLWTLRLDLWRVWLEMFSILRRIQAPFWNRFKGASFPRIWRKNFCRTFKGTIFVLVFLCVESSGAREGERSRRFYKSRLTFSQTIASEVTAKKKTIVDVLSLTACYVYSAWCSPQHQHNHSDIDSHFLCVCQSHLIRSAGVFMLRTGITSPMFRLCLLLEMARNNKGVHVINTKSARRGNGIRWVGKAEPGRGIPLRESSVVCWYVSAKFGTVSLQKFILLISSHRSGVSGIHNRK